MTVVSDHQIGEFSALTGLPVKTLRYYDAIGLLAPTALSPAGHRVYADTQVDLGTRIAALRGIGLSPALIAQSLAGHDVLTEHRVRLQARLERTRGQLHLLTHLLEGDPMSPSTDHHLPDEDERRLAVGMFNDVWRLLETENRDAATDDELVHLAHASRHHWGRIGGPAQLARGEWLCSRVYAVLGRAEPALHHARRVLALCEEHGLVDWDLGFAHEALARAFAVAGDVAAARTELARARDERVEDEGDRALLESDLATVEALVN